LSRARAVGGLDRAPGCLGPCRRRAPWPALAASGPPNVAGRATVQACVSHLCLDDRAASSASSWRLSFPVSGSCRPRIVPGGTLRPVHCDRNRPRGYDRRGEPLAMRSTTGCGTPFGDSDEPSSAVGAGMVLAAGVPHPQPHRRIYWATLRFGCQRAVIGRPRMSRCSARARCRSRTRDRCECRSGP
jgi:hypothetical protein